MDFPIDINKGLSVFVDRFYEFKQDIYLLLKNNVRSFLQDRNMGSFVPEHGSGDIDLVKYGIERTLSQLSSLELVSCDVTQISYGKYNVTLQVRYIGEEVTLTTTL